MSDQVQHGPSSADQPPQPAGAGTPAGHEPPSLEANRILGALYTPPDFHGGKGTRLFWSAPEGRPRTPDQPFPFPPADYRMGHSADDRKYLEAGEKNANAVRRILEREKVSLDGGASLLEWGCASGRTLRHFAREAERGDFWGADQHGPCILWAKQNLSPPFKFLTCTAYPHLPFEDNKFTAVFGLSVFTHIAHLVDAWLMEFRRILRPGGYALFSIHDEHTWRILAEDAGLRETWLRHGWIGEEDLSQDLGHDVAVYKIGGGGDWGRIVTFFRTAWVAREWGQYLDVVSFEPGGIGYQTLVVLRKS
jgi:SAM-dependent methyltransferase